MQLNLARAILLCKGMLLAAAGLLIGTCAAAAQTQLERGVTIFSDGLSQPDGRAPQALVELARVLSGKNVVRPLPVLSHGGVANVKDLIHSRGVDFAVLNSDIFAYLDLSGQEPEAKDKIRYVTQLFRQKAYLLARKNISSINQLSGKTVALIGPEASTGVTARTILQKSGLALGRTDTKVNVIQLPDALASDTLPFLDAVFLLEHDIGKLPGIVAASGEFQLIPIPVNDSLASTYRPALIAANEITDFPAEQQVATIAVDTVLATYNWTPRHGRYTDIAEFIDAFFAALPGLRETLPNSIWPDVDVNAEIIGWARFRHADAARHSVPQRKNDAEPTGDEAAAKPFDVAVEAIEDRPATAAFRSSLSVVSTPPLTDETLENGGLITELATAVIRRAFADEEQSINVIWSKDRHHQIEEISKKTMAGLAIPWETPDCDKPQNLGPEQAMICDNALISAPLFQVPIVFFTRADSKIDFKTDESIAGRVLCAHSGRDLGGLNGLNEHWVTDYKVTLLRPATLIDCLSKVESGEADALIGNEAECRFAINRLGLSDAFKIADRPIATRGIHIVIPKHLPNAETVLTIIDRMIAEFKKSDDYTNIINRHLPSLTRQARSQTQ